MSIPLVSYFMKHYYNGTLSELFYLKQEARSSRSWTLDDLAAEIEETSSLSKGDVAHATSILMTEIRKVLVRGDRVKISGLGTFYMTLSCEGVEREEELNVRNVRKVNIRFRPDKALKLVNNALAVTRSVNNVSFAIVGDSGDGSAGAGTSTGGGNSNGGTYIDPNA